MPVAISVAATLAFSGLFALVVVRAPRLGVRNHQRAALVVAVSGIVVATAVAGILIGAPLVFGFASWDWWPSIVTNYFLAMAHRVIGGPYPFNWTPSWIYFFGSLMPLIAFGAVVALAAGYSARSYARRASVVIMSVAFCLLVGFLAAGVYASAATRGGIPL